MAGSWKIRVLKRDRSVEDFDPQKLSASMSKAMLAVRRGGLREARDLAIAIGIYLARSECRCISSAAILEMAIKVLHRAGMGGAAVAMESHHFWRAGARRRLRLCHESGRASAWNKSWLRELATRIWNISPVTAAILADEVERELLSQSEGDGAGGRGAGPTLAFGQKTAQAQGAAHPAKRARLIPREAVVAMLNERVAQFGLADAVPVRQYAMEE
jgi:hypothetical protein